MPELIDLVLLLVAGALGGFLSGILGVGGGIVFIPILDIVIKQYGIQDEVVKYILANSLMVIVFTGTFNTWRQYKAKNFFPRYILYTAIPGVFTVLLGAYLIGLGDWYRKEIFNIVFAALLIPSIIRMIAQGNKPDELKELIPMRQFGIVGAVTGIFTAFSGLGGGLIMIPAFVNLLKLEMKKAISVSAGVVPLFALPTALYYMVKNPLVAPVELAHVGFLLYPVVIPMILGTLLTVPLGVKIGHKMPPSRAKIIFTLFVSLVLLKMFWETFL